VAAYLAKQVDTLKFGEEVQDFVRFSAPKPKPVDGNRLRGVVLKVDRFGNLITNITPKDAPALFEAQPAAFKIVVGTREISDIRKTYAEGAPGDVFGVLGSMGFLEIAANRGAAAQVLNAGKGTDVTVVLGDAAAAGRGA
jgi:S-adenosyl-L-methionine hydrolase (adenosine-forming)